VRLEPRAGRRRDRLQHREVVRRRRDGDVAHRSGERRQLCLNIDPVAIPAKERVDRERVPVIPRAG
jgi:hypothetical protein